jgi:hypothetical protein
LRALRRAVGHAAHPSLGPPFRLLPVLAAAISGLTRIGLGQLHVAIERVDHVGRAVELPVAAFFTGVANPATTPMTLPTIPAASRMRAVSGRSNALLANSNGKTRQTRTTFTARFTTIERLTSTATT